MIKNRTFKYSCAIFLIAFVMYISNLPYDFNKNLLKQNHRRLITSNDVVPNTFLPYVLLTKGTIEYSSVRKIMTRIDGQETPSFLIKIGDKYYSKYPVFTGFMAVPIYLIPVLLNKIPDLRYYENILKILALGRISASFYTAISVALFYWLINIISDHKNRLWHVIFTVFYAFGTNSWSISSRSLWQHTSAQLFITLCIIFLILNVKSQKKGLYIFIAGLFAGLSVIARPTSVIFALPVSIYVFFNYRKEFKKWVYGIIPSIIFWLTYNLLIFGSPFTEGYQKAGDTEFSTPLLTGLQGNLFSPGKSILFISPPLILAYLYIARMLFKKGKDSYERLFFFFGLSIILMYIVISTWWSWDSADRFGYGLLTEFLPILALFAFVMTQNFSLNKKGIIMLLILYSIYVQYVGVFYKKSRCDPDEVWGFKCLTMPDKPLDY